MDDRKNVKISESAYDALDRLVTTAGLKQWVVVERHLAWLDKQSEAFKKAVVYGNADPAAVLLAEKMAQVKGGGETPESVEQALPMIRYLLDRIEKDHERLSRQNKSNEEALAEIERKRKGK